MFSLHKWLLVSLIAICAIPAMGQSQQDSIRVDTVLTVANSPHIFDDTKLVIKAGVTLTIEAGASINFTNSSWIEMLTNSKVLAIGTVLDTIQWTGGFISGDNAIIFDPTSPAAISGLIDFAYTHFEQFGGTIGVSLTQIKSSYMYQSRGVSGIYSFSFSSYPEVLIMEDCRLIDCSSMIFEAIGTIKDSDFVGGTNVLNTSFVGPFPVGNFCTTSLSGCTFDGMNTVVEGLLEEVCIANCTFTNNDVGIDLSSVFTSGQVTDCTFENNHIALDNVGSYAYDFVSRCEIRNNDIGITVAGNHQGQPIPSPDGNGFLENIVCGNDTNVVINTSAATNLEDNCWCETDSATIAGTFVVSSGNTANYTLLPLNLDCMPGLVYPGDTDHDQLCDLSDLFPIGIFYGLTGPARQNASLQWTGQIATDWTDSLANGQNVKHVDTDGDGNINDADTLAILLNYGLTHQNPRPSGIMAGDAKLRFASLPNVIMPDETISLPIYLGDMDTSLVGLYGFLFEFDYDTSLISDLKLFSNNSWVGTEGNDMLGITRNVAGRVGAAYIRTDQTTVDGYGEIGQLQITMASSLPDSFDISFLPVRQAGIKLDESPIEIGAEALTQTIYSFNVGVERSALAGIKIYPNPSEGKFVLESEQHRINRLSLFNTNGQLIMQEKVEKYTWSAQLTSLPKGLYLLKVDTDAGLWQEKLIIR